jgi:hypothetical protein
LRTLTPADYRGQALCPRCGDDGTGTNYYVCAEATPTGQRFTHQESCQTYRYSDDLCVPCDVDLLDEFPHLKDAGA